ncbi:hypothetical protein [Prevotella sp.]|uniref:hypothetical protein n=1 Tax=Prevotella sp. TaxID=59823 RepID=UPI003AB92CAF
MIVKMSNMLLSALISGPCVVKNDFDAFCNFCIAVMTALAKSWGVTYGTANVVLFVILMPLIIVLFFVAALFKRENMVAKICFYSGIVITIAIIVSLMIAFADTILLTVKD